ncbi:MAG: hypothetical protein FWH34_08345 [Desulfovibrionaceae bacterium]|nr:hypothetical protein [Desulfovibrionaceae bacterium]
MKLSASMLYGMAQSRGCLLSEIGRALKEPISLKNTIERLSIGLENLGEPQAILKSFAEIVRDRIDDNTIFVGDGSDLTKPYGKAFECLERVHDGSTGELENGYWTLEFAALTHGHKTPLPIYDRVYSVSEAGYKSQANELFKTINILQAAKRLKGKYALPFTTKSGEVKHCKASVQAVSLPALPGKQFRLVCLHGLGEEPLMLPTNLEQDDPRLNAAVVKVYLMRWRIEEHFASKNRNTALKTSASVR